MSSNVNHARTTMTRMNFRQIFKKDKVVALFQYTLTQLHSLHIRFLSDIQYQKSYAVWTLTTNEIVKISNLANIWNSVFTLLSVTFCSSLIKIFLLISSLINHHHKQLLIVKNKCKQALCWLYSLFFITVILKVKVVQKFYMGNDLGQDIIMQNK